MIELNVLRQDTELMNFHALHPKTKLTLLLTLYGLSFIYPSWFVYVFTIPVLFLLHLTHNTLKTWSLSLFIVLPYIGMLVLINGILVPTTQDGWFQFYSFALSQKSIQVTLEQTKSVVSLVFILFTLFKHTPRRVTLSSFQSSWVKMVLVLGLLILNSLKEASNSLQEMTFIQLTRTSKPRYSFFDRIKGLLSLMMSILNQQMMMSQQRQLSYALRGFQFNQVNASKHKVSTPQRRIITITIVLLLVLLGMEGLSWI